MTTKARIAALQWFHDRGETSRGEGMPSFTMIGRMFDDLQLKWRPHRKHVHGLYSLTDKGRKDLHEATK